MNEDTNDQKDNSLPASKTEPVSKTQKIQRKIRWTIIKIIATVFWSYAFLKLFIFDVDILLIQWLFPGATWLIEYRGVFTIAIFALLALLMWNFKLLGGLLYIGFFPFIFVFFHIPAWLIRRRAWTLSVAVIAGSISLIRSLRSTIILSGLFVVGTVLVSVSVNVFFSGSE
ncbi:MAG: hypothetical protein H6657_06450 [Ardenticatenaceae bacterium]|nr:hypothetical protein [Ardenticatenaceae bacterium]